MILLNIIDAKTHKRFFFFVYTRIHALNPEVNKNHIQYPYDGFLWIISTGAAIDQILYWRDKDASGFGVTMLTNQNTE